MSIKKSGHLIGAVIFGMGVLIFHDQIAVLLASFVASDLPTDSNDTPITNLNVVVYAGVGTVLFLLLRFLEILIFEKKTPRSTALEYGHLAIRMLRWAAVFVFGDLVLQNLSGTNTTIKDYSMSYQAIGGLIAIEIIVLRSFFSSDKKEHTNNSLQT